MPVVASLVNFDKEAKKIYENKINNTIKIIRIDEPSDEIEILICRDRDLTKEFIIQCSNLKFIYVVSAGVERLPFNIIKSRGILVANASGICNESISDYVIGTMLAFSSRIYDCILYKEDNFWKPYLYTDTLRDKTLTIVGTGKIGHAICIKAKAFGLHVIGVRKNQIKDDIFDEIVLIDKLIDVLPKSDYVVCTVPLTEETYHLFNYDKFLLMKDSSVFINISRGKLVNEQDVVRALEEKQIYGAALDVFEVEPLPKSSKLWNTKNLIISPHSSGRLIDFMDYAMDIFTINYMDYIKNRNLSNKVDVELGY